MTTTKTTKKKFQRKPLYGSDVIVDLLTELEIEYVSANIGSSFRGFWDSLVNYQTEDNEKKNVKCISVCHEEIAVALAHGFAKASLKPMVALVHDVVGLQHASMAIYNAWCDGVPILVLGAEGPMDWTKRRPWIDWIHTANIPNTLVRDYVKWDAFLTNFESTPEALVRAYEIATSKPQGPVFVCFDSSLLEEKLAKNVIRKYTALSPKTRMPPSQSMDSDISPDPDAVSKVAKMILVDAEYPLIIAGRVGREPSLVKELVKLAELVGAPVIDTGESFNFPSTHYLDVTEIEGEVEKADLILSFDSQMIGRILSSGSKIADPKKRWLMRPDARFVRIGLSGISPRGWSNLDTLYDREAISIYSSNGNAIRGLIKSCLDLKEYYPKKGIRLAKKIDDRAQKVRIKHSKQREKWRRESKSKWKDKPISTARLAYEIFEAVRRDRWTIAHGLLGGWVRKLWDMERPGCYLGTSGGAGLGYGLGASIGAALALSKEKDSLVLDLQPDGDFLYTPSALWTLSHHDLPLLIIMYNNRAYHNDAEHNELIAKARGRDEDRAYHEGGEIVLPNVDYSRLAESFGISGFGPIDSPEDIRGSLEEGLKTVRKDRKPALIDFITQRR
jgi:acetolactate synthase-1/2/3 large subunit